MENKTLSELGAVREGRGEILCMTEEERGGCYPSTSTICKTRVGLEFLRRSRPLTRTRTRTRTLTLTLSN